jgi:carboxypeptidase PM20D1
MWRLIRRGLTAVAILVIGLASVLVVNAVRVGPSKHELAPAPRINIDVPTAAQRLGQAIRFRTVSKPPGVPADPQAFRDLHQFLIRSFPLVHKHLAREVIGEYSLLYRWEGSDQSRKPILLSAHMDVVPEQGRWTWPPFSGAVEGGFIWGRGALDDKVAVLAILEAAEYLLSKGFRPHRTIYLAFGHDEEIDGRNGAARIATRLKEREVRLAAIYDEGWFVSHGLVPGIMGPVAFIGTAEKGYLSLELLARTSGGHSSVPSERSAIRVLLDAEERLKVQPFEAALKPPITEALDHLAPEFSFLPRMILANRWLFGPLLLAQLEKVPETNALVRTTTAVTIIGAGTKDNILPARARLVVNFRIVPGQTVASVTARVRRIVADRRISIRQYGAASDPSPIAATGSEAYRQLVKSVRQEFPKAAIAPALVVSASDSRHYTQLADQIFRFRPMRLSRSDLGRIHGIDERIAITNYGEHIRFWVRLMRNTAGAGARRE